MGKILLVYKGNYADEFNFTAGVVVNDTEWPSSVDDPMLAGIDLDYEHERYYGTNESVFVSVREIIEDTEVIRLETGREEMIANKLGGTFDVVFDVVFESIYEREAERKHARNKARWAALTDEERETYIKIFNARKATPFKTLKEEYEHLGEALQAFWKEHGFEGYWVFPDTL